MLGINTDESFQMVLEQIREFPFKPDLFLLTGDLVQDAEASTYERLRTQLDQLPAPVYCLPGNHDDPELMQSVLEDQRQIFIQPHISLLGWDIVCLNSTIPNNPCGSLPKSELALLDETLSAIPAHHHALVAFHHPPFAVGSKWLDTMMIGNAEELWEVLERHETVRAIVLGHVHQELDEMIGRYRVLASPSTCFQFRPRSDEFAIDAVPPGFRWIRLGEDGRIDSGVERLTRVPAGLDTFSAGY
jgi:Icc protein